MATSSSSSSSLVHSLLFPSNSTPLIHHFKSIKHLIKCTPSSSSNDPNFPSPPPESISTTTNFPIEKRRNSVIIRDRTSRSLTKPEPPNFEIGWKRTKKINTEKPNGYLIIDFLEKLQGLMEREVFGSTELLAKTGEIVAERAREEAEVLRDEGKVEDRMVTELFRVLKLMEMDLAMVKASVKDDTLALRLDQAKARCRQAILVATSF
ncbi:hypothetical protein ACFE04_008454 [Oxalis oulophora]